MALAGDPTNASSAAIYPLRVNRKLADQLASHLRGFCAPSGDRPVVEVKPASPMRPEPGRSDGPVRLRSDQLESTLRCIEQAARTMVELDEMAVSADERANLQHALASLEQRLLTFERDYENMSDALHDARREAEEYRCRSQLAETKLESLLEAVAKMIEPLGHPNLLRRLQTLPAGRAMPRNDEVRA